MNERDDTVEHGGDLAAASARYGTPSGGWVDLSTGINPFPYPVSDIDTLAWTRLPDNARMEQLRETAWRAYGGGERAAIALAPGTQALIERLPQIGPGRARVAVISPTYGEHARVWRRDKHDVAEIHGLPDAIDFDVVVLANPNNPDGRLFARDDLMALADELGAKNGMLIIDESFADVVPHRSLAGEAGHRGILILRSFGKFFGLAGLRLGFAIGSPRIIRRLDALIGPWPVSGPAIEIGIRALGDVEWIEETRGRLVKTAHRLDAILKDFGFTVVGGTPLFRLLEHHRAQELHRRLAAEGVFTRRFDYAPNWLRFGLPGNQYEFAFLERVLATAASELIVDRAGTLDG